MKKTVLKFGLLSGGVSTALMLATVPFMHTIGFDYGLVIGYTAIVLSFLFVFFGVRSYREAHGGTLSFGRGFSVGILITLISCCFYVATWEVVYFKLSPGFWDKYSAYELDKVKRQGGTAEDIQAKAKEFEQFKVMYDNPLVNVAFTFVEPFPVGVLVTLISAGVLRRKPAGAPVRT